MDIGVLLIDSELLTGKGFDGHLNQAVRVLGGRGLDLAWCQVLGNQPARIVQSLRRSMDDGDIVFSFGGIGCAAQGHIRECAARAAGVPLQRHPGALAAIEARYGADPDRSRLADLPLGCGLIPNPVDGCPGFSLGDHHFLPGVPEMDWPMMEWVFDHRYLDLGHAGPPVEYLVQAHDAREADLLELMGQLVERYPEVRIASLPHCSADPRDLEFGVRGREAGARRGLRWLTGELDLRGYRWEARRQPAG